MIIIFELLFILAEAIVGNTAEINSSAKVVPKNANSSQLVLR